MKVQCTSCTHNAVCRNAHLMKEITETVDAAINQIEATVGDKTCGIKDLTWIDLNKMTVVCVHYRPSSVYRSAELMAETCQNSIRNSNIF